MGMEGFNKLETKEKELSKNKLRAMIAPGMASSENFSLWGDIERHFRQQWGKDNKDRLGGYETLTPAQIAEMRAYLEHVQ